jgi:hypothetical protein
MVFNISDCILGQQIYYLPLPLQIPFFKKDRGKKINPVNYTGLIYKKLDRGSC